jgi:Mrp family chromosome partitioning ATPase
MNLAGALAAAGKQAVVVLLRHDPGLERRLHMNGGPGFTDALAMTVSIRDTLRSGDYENLWFCGHGSSAATSGSALAMVPVGTYSDLLGSERAKQVIAELTASADYVLVDAPPMEADADAYLLAGACDGVLAVATLATTTRSEVEQASEQFERVRATLLGSVVVDPGQREKLPTVQARPVSAASGFNGESLVASPRASRELETALKWRRWAGTGITGAATPVVAAELEGRDD